MEGLFFQIERMKREKQEVGTEKKKRKKRNKTGRAVYRKCT